MTDTPIRAARHGHVREVTMDRPKANAIDLATSRIMGQDLNDFRDDPELRVAILTGAGEMFFLAGWHLRAAAAGDAVDGDCGVGGFGGFGGLQELRDLNKPVSAAVNGIARGGGLEITLSADLIVAADTATLALPEIRSGTVADSASIRLPKRIPYHVAMDLLVTGRWFDAAEAPHWGLLNRVVRQTEVMAEARGRADLLASGPPLVYAEIKEIVREAEDMTFQDARNRVTTSQFATVEALYRSEDQLVGARTCAESREPVWSGR